MSIEMETILGAFGEYVAFGLGYMVFSTILTVIFRPLGYFSTYLIPIGFIAIPFIGKYPRWSYIVAFLMVFLISFIIIEGLKILFRK